jgi:hypothetical protein
MISARSSSRYRCLSEKSERDIPCCNFDFTDVIGKLFAAFTETSKTKQPKINILPHKRPETDHYLFKCYFRVRVKDVCVRRMPPALIFAQNPTLPERVLGAAGCDEQNPRLCYCKRLNFRAVPNTCRRPSGEGQTKPQMFEMIVRTQKYRKIATIDTTDRNECTLAEVWIQQKSHRHSDPGPNIASSPYLHPEKTEPASVTGHGMSFRPERSSPIINSLD